MNLHSYNWTSDLYAESQWTCIIDRHTFQELHELEEHMRLSHKDAYTERQIPTIARRSLTLRRREANECLLCGYDPILAQRNLERTPNHNLEDRTSLAESSDPYDKPRTKGSPRVSDLAIAKQLARHIAEHLRAFSFISLRLGAFTDSGDSSTHNTDSVGSSSRSTTSRGEHETSSSGGSHGRRSELDDVSLIFEDEPRHLDLDVSGSSENDNGYQAPPTAWDRGTVPGSLGTIPFEDPNFELIFDKTARDSDHGDGPTAGYDLSSTSRDPRDSDAQRAFDESYFRRGFIFSWRGNQVERGVASASSSVLGNGSASRVNTGDAAYHLAETGTESDEEVMKIDDLPGPSDAWHFGHDLVGTGGVFEDPKLERSLTASMNEASMNDVVL